jgi:hypothetical protein
MTQAELSIWAAMNRWQHTHPRSQGGYLDG